MIMGLLGLDMPEPIKEKMVEIYWDRSPSDSRRIRQHIILDFGKTDWSPEKAATKARYLMNSERQTITVREAAKIIGCSHVLLYSEIKKGRFTQVIRIGHRIVVPIAALEKYLANAGAGNVAQ